MNTTPTFIWDHSITYVDNLSAAAATFAEHGLTAAYGGRHVGHGTENALAYFGLNYLELLALDDPDAARAQTDERGLIFADALRRLPDREGLFRVALRVHDIRAAYETLAARGLRLGDIVDGNRTTASGQEIRWKLLFILGDADGLPYPFVIDWQQADDERSRALQRGGLLGQHPAGEVHTRRAVFEVPDPRRIAEQWSGLFGFTREGRTLVVGEGLSFEFVDGPRNGLREIRYAAPAGHGFDFSIGDARFRTA